MPCNPAIGGTAKGHLVREIDAMGGLMGLAIDATGIQFKLLNRSRGPAVWSPRAQADKRRYGAWMRETLAAEPNIEWLFRRAGRVIDIGRPRHRSRVRGGRRGRVRRAGRHDRDVSQRARARRRRAAAVGTRRRAADAPTGRFAARLRLRDGPAQDRHAAAARSTERWISRGFPRRTAIGRSCRSRSCPARSSASRSRVTCCTRRRRCTISCDGASIALPCSTARSRASARGIARRSRTR